MWGPGSSSRKALPPLPTEGRQPGHPGAGSSAGHGTVPEPTGPSGAGDKHPALPCLLPHPLCSQAGCPPLLHWVSSDVPAAPCPRLSTQVLPPLGDIWSTQGRWEGEGHCPTLGRMSEPFSSATNPAQSQAPCCFSQCCLPGYTAGHWCSGHQRPSHHIAETTATWHSPGDPGQACCSHAGTEAGRSRCIQLWWQSQSAQHAHESLQQRDKGCQAPTPVPGAGPPGTQGHGECWHLIKCGSKACPCPFLPGASPVIYSSVFGLESCDITWPHGCYTSHWEGHRGPGPVSVTISVDNVTELR